MADLGTLIVELQAKTDQFNTQFGQASKAIADFEKASNLAEKATRMMQEGIADTSGPLEKLVGSFTAAAVQVNIFSRALNHLEKDVKEVFDLMEGAARAKSAETYFNRASLSIEDFRKATGGLISDAQIYKSVNLGMQMGLTAADMQKLAQVARAAAAETGESFETMYTKIITGEERESARILSHAGILMSAKDAYTEYAVKLNDADKAQQYAGLSLQYMSTHLDDTAKRAAILQYTLENSQPILDKYGLVGEQDAEKFDKFKASVDNLKTSLGNLLNDIFGGSAIASLTRFVSGLQDIVQNLQAVLKYASAWEVLKAAASGAYGGQKMSLSDLANPMALVAKLNQGAAQGVNDLGAQKREQALEDLYKQRAAQEAILYREGVSANDVIAGTGEAMKNLNDWTGPAVKTLRDLNAQILALGGVGILDMSKTTPGPVGGVNMPETASVGKLKDPMKEYDRMIKDMLHQRVTDAVDAIKHGTDTQADDDFLKAWAPEQFKTLVEEQLHKQYLRAIAAIKAGMGTQDDWDTLAKVSDDDFNKFAEHVSEQFDKLNKTTDEFIASMDDFIASIDKKLHDEVGKGADQIVKGAMSGGAGGVQMVSAGIGTVVGAFAGNAQLGGEVGQYLGDFLSKLKPIVAFMDNVATAIQQLLKLGFEPLAHILDPIGQAFYTLFAAIGILINAAIKPFIPFLLAIADGLAYLIEVVAAVAVALAPFVEAFTALAGFSFTILEVFYDLVAIILKLFGVGGVMGLQDGLKAAAQDIQNFAVTVVGAAVTMNNGIVKFVDGLGTWLQQTIGTDFGLSTFGQNVSLTDLLATNNDATTANTSATKSNTQAVNNLSREFRNLPSGYKVNYPIYQSTDPNMRNPRFSATLGAQLSAGAFFRNRF